MVSNLDQYDLEIQELSSPLRILVNTHLAKYDEQPGYFQKMEWVFEARIVLRKATASLLGNENGQSLVSMLEEKIRAAEEVAQKLSPYQNVSNQAASANYDEYDEYDDEEYDDDEYNDEDWDRNGEGVEEEEL